MSSDKQIAANRLNAQGSTGPRSPAGKAKVSTNALRHGLTGRSIVLPNENPEDFEAFRAGLLTSLDPQDELEEALADKYVADAWRLRRVPSLEATVFRCGYQESVVRQAKESVRKYEHTVLEEFSLKEKEVAACRRQAHEEAEQKLERARAELDDPSFHAPRVLKKYSQPLSNLWRYEVALERSMLRTLHELQRLQAKRAREHVPAPEVVDLDVSFSEPPGTDIRRTSTSGETDGNQE